ncbi:MAG: OmpA family protein [Pyrinomonadaceae bacterium]
MSEDKNNPKQPPPDDFSETRPNINLPKDTGAANTDWEKTNYGYKPQPPADDWGKTVANQNIPKSETDFEKTYLPSNQPKGNDDWAMTQAHINLPTDFGSKPEDYREKPNQQINENYDLTTPLIRLPEAERAKYQNLPPTSAQESAKQKEEQKKKGGIPAWVFIAGGLLMMFLFAVTVLIAVKIFFLNDKGFELVLKGVPIGSDVYIDKQGPWGVTSEDGSIKLPILKSGETKVIEIKHPNYNCKSIEIVGEGGTTAERFADCTFLKPTDDCADIKSTDIEKSEQCAVQALEKLSDPPSIDELLKALSMQIINFKSGSSEIPPQRMDFLKKAAGYINKLPPSVVIEVGGYTDDIGSDASNQKLSESRAAAVRDSLVKFGVGAERLQSKGYGKADPKVPNKDNESRAKNRRIEYKAVKR